MIKKFIKGMLYGAIFTIVSVILIYIGSLIIHLVFISPSTKDTTYHSTARSRTISMDADFRRLPVDEKIQKADAIALAQYERTGNGRNKAVIREFVKLNPGMRTEITVGDTLDQLDADDEEENHFDGFVLFFVDSPAFSKPLMGATSISNGQIMEFDNISLEQFRKKCLPYPPHGSLTEPMTKRTRKDFHNLPIEKQIQIADTIALAQYINTDDSQTRPVIQEFLKKGENSITQHYVGQILPARMYQFNDDENIEGIILFHVGKNMTSAVPYKSDGRIPSLADIPLELFRKKCREGDS